MEIIENSKPRNMKKILYWQVDPVNYIAFLFLTFFFMCSVLAVILENLGYIG